MNVLVIDPDSAFRARLWDALSMVCEDAHVYEAANLDELREREPAGPFQLMVVGRAAPDGLMPTLLYLRGRWMSADLMVAMPVGDFDPEGILRLVKCLACQILESRMSAMLLAMVLRPVCQKWGRLTEEARAGMPLGEDGTAPAGAGSPMVPPLAALARQ